MIAPHQHLPILLQTLGIRRERLMRMQLVVAQMAHQRRLVLDLPIAVFPLDETVMLCGAPQCGFTALLDLVADLAGIDVGDRAGEIDARAPSRERRQQRQFSQVTAIALSSGAGELTALLGRGLGNPTGDGNVSSKSLTSKTGIPSGLA